jgi:hypothetical protein
MGVELSVPELPFPELPPELPFPNCPNLSAIWLDPITCCSHGVCNFSHTHQWRLLTGFCEETVGTSTTTSLCARLRPRRPDPIDERK